LQDCEAQERSARDLQEPKAQTASGMNRFNALSLQRFNDEAIKCWRVEAIEKINLTA
jgi:hypothetical protein